MTAYDLTDEQIIAAFGSAHRHTYELRNILAAGRPNLKTSFVRQRLLRLERESKVRRVKSYYFAYQLCWEAVTPQSETTGAPA